MNPPDGLTGPFTLPDVTLVQPAESSTRHTELQIRGDRIAARADGQGRILQEYRGAYVVPGLVDMHTHLPPKSPLHLTESVLLLNIAHGVTTIRDAGDADGTSGDAARQAIERGHPGPRLSTAGSFVTRGRTRWPNSVQMTGPGQAADIVARAADAGHRWIKSYEGLGIADIAALVTAAERRGLGVLGHVPTALRHDQTLLPDAQHFFGVADPGDLGADTVLCRSTDWRGVTDRRLEEVVRHSLDHGLVHTPTLVATEALLSYRDYDAARRDPKTGMLPPLYADRLWHPQHGFPVYRGIDGARLDLVAQSLRLKLRLVGFMHSAGVPLRLGTDSQPFTIPGQALHAEMRLFSQAGVPAPEVWRMATSGAGRTLGPGLGEPALGTLAPGAPADLLLYDADPTSRTDPSDGLKAVVTQGRLYTRAALDAALAADRRRLRRPLPSLLGRVGSKRVLRTTDFAF
ncbi:amidohydrolase family protein [Streptomyces mirabilis]|uniref:amidohydrolase family protein n=1 Tax=Streptomyces mirabilis TaxID=68239 RepID=UPI0033286D79